MNTLRVLANGAEFQEGRVLLKGHAFLLLRMGGGALGKSVGDGGLADSQQRLHYLHLSWDLGIGGCAKGRGSNIRQQIWAVCVVASLFWTRH